MINKIENLNVLGGYYDTLPELLVEHKKGVYDFVNADSAEFENVRQLRIHYNTLRDACRSELISRYPEGRTHAIYLNRHWLAPAVEKHRQYLIENEI